MKLAGALMIMLAAALYGIGKRWELKRRVDCLDSIICALGLLKTEIEFSQEKLKNALIRIDKHINTCSVFSSCANNIEKGIKPAWNEAVDGASGLFPEDKEVLKRLGARLGMTNVGDQAENISYVTALLNENKKAAQDMYTKYARLYSTGGLLAGAGIVILLI